MRICSQALEISNEGVLDKLATRWTCGPLIIKYGFCQKKSITPLLKQVLNCFILRDFRLGLLMGYLLFSERFKIHQTLQFEKGACIP